MKKLVTLLFYYFISFSIGTHAYAGDVDIYNNAVEHINNYDIEHGLQEMNKVIHSETANEDLKIKSYFWIAFIKLFDGYEEQAHEAIKELLSYDMGFEYDIDELPLELSGNAQVMAIYEKEKSNFLKVKKQLSEKASKHLEKAEKYYNRGKLNKAKKELRLVLELEPKNQNAKDLVNKIQETEMKLVMQEDAIEYSKVTSRLENAKEVYWERDLDEAEKILDMILKIEPEEQEAKDFKNKIQKTREIKVKICKRLEEKIFRSAESYYNAGNMLGAMQEATRVLKYNPEHQDAYTLFQEAYRRLQNIIKTATKKKKKIFHKAINYYQDEDYKAAVKYFKKLQLVIPEIDIFISHAMANILIKKSRIKARKYYKIAIEVLRNNCYKRARENLLHALMLDIDYLDALVLLEEIKDLKFN